MPALLNQGRPGFSAVAVVQTGSNAWVTPPQPGLAALTCPTRSALSTFSMERGIVNRERASKSYHVLVRVLSIARCP